MRFSDIPLLSGAQGLGGHSGELQADRFRFIDRANREINDIGRVRLSMTELLFVNTPRSMREVLVEKARSFEKSPVLTTSLYPLGGQGLFTSGGDLWRRQRKLMAPIFHQVQVSGFAPAMAECARRGVQGWSEGEVVNVAHETTRIAMSVAGRTLFGADTFDDGESIGQALTVALAWVDQATMSRTMLGQVVLRGALEALSDRVQALAPVLDGLVARLEPPILWPSETNRRMAEAIATLDEYVKKLLRERRASSETHLDLLSRLLRARDEDDGATMDDRQIRDEILTLFIAGHETTANGLAWSMYLLGRHPEAYQKARATVDALEGRAPTLADVPRLAYLTRVFKEALRLYPPLYLYGRIAVDDVEIAGYEVPKRTVVLLSPYAVHRRPEIWPDPLRFDPDRFLPEAEAARPRSAYLPFSDGPRVCIGAQFSLLEAPLVLASMLQRADLSLVGDAAGATTIVPDASATMRPVGGVPMRVKLRAQGDVKTATA